MGDKEGFELEKGNEDPMNYQSPSLSSDWRFSASNLSSVSLGVVPPNNLMGSSSCSTASMVDSYSPTLWDNPTNSQNLGYDTTSPPGTMGIRKAFLSPPNPMLKGGLFLPGMLPQCLSQFPADSGFIERAARFSSFNGGSFSDMLNPFCIPEPMSPYSRGHQEAYFGNGLKSVFGGQSQKNELNVSEASKEHSPMKNESVVRSHEEVKLGGSGNESDEAEFSGQDEPNPNPLEGAKEIGPKKRKRSGQDTELDKSEEASRKPDDSAKDKAETQQKADQNPTKASDLPKEDYIHVRARRGQATNSHSLAERVRREKISERMKFLQDLVPGCSKVTGKAVMLDEIINYVQSLQRQVEFLSMKLATVNPRLDVNIEGLLAKDVLHSRPGASSSLGYAPDMPMAFPLLHPSQPGLIQAGAQGIGSSNVLRRNINPQLTSQHVANMWEDELHNVVQMNFGTSTPLSSQEVNEFSYAFAETTTPGQMKVEL